MAIEGPKAAPDRRLCTRPLHPTSTVRFFDTSVRVLIRRITLYLDHCLGDLNPAPGGRRPTRSLGFGVPDRIPA